MAECYYLPILLYSLSVPFCFLLPQTSSLNFELTNVVDQDQRFKTFGRASFSSQGLELTSNQTNSDSDYKAGGAAYDEPLHLWDKTTRKLADFNTSFVFVIDSKGEKIWDDFRFFLAPEGLDLPNTDFSSVVSVEFNAAENKNVTINVRSYTANVAAGWYVDTADGKENRAWISYNSTSQSLSVVFTGSTNTSRVQDSISFSVDLRDHLPDWVTVGFYGRGWYSSSYYQTNTVKSWEFSSNLELNQTNNTAPAVSKPFSVGTVVGWAAGSSGFLGVVALLVTYRVPVGNALIGIGGAASYIGNCLVNLPMCCKSSPPNNSEGTKPPDPSKTNVSSEQLSVQDSARANSSANQESTPSTGDP